MLTERSQFIDFQKVTLSSPENEETEHITELPAYFDDDIVGTVSEDTQYSLTGVIRAYQEGTTNEFKIYLDVLSARDEAQVDTPDRIDSILDSHWGVD